MGHCRVTDIRALTTAPLQRAAIFDDAFWYDDDGKVLMSPMIRHRLTPWPIFAGLILFLAPVLALLILNSK